MPFSLTSAETVDILVRLIASGVGALGFAMMFRTPPKKIPVATLGGMLTYAMYAFVIVCGGEVLIASFCSALVMALFSEISARIMRAPAILFLFSCLIPIVPGNALYNTMYNLLSYDSEKLLYNAKIAFDTVLGIAVGLGVASIIIGVVLQIVKAVKENSKK